MYYSFLQIYYIFILFLDTIMRKRSSFLLSEFFSKIFLTEVRYIFILKLIEKQNIS